MTNGTYDTRREQIEKDFAPRLLGKWRPTRKAVLEELKGAAIIGACEERLRVIGIVQDMGTLTNEQRRMLLQAIAAKSVTEVLGYPS